MKQKPSKTLNYEKAARSDLRLVQCGENRSAPTIVYSDGLTKSHTSYTVTIICDRSKSVAIRPKCGFLRITGLYRINNKTCGLLDLQDSLESSESTAKLGVNTLIKIIYNMHIHLV